MLRSPLLASSFALALYWTPTTATAAAGKLEDRIQPRGVLVEFMPGATFCIPSLVVKCNDEYGKTKPFLGGSFLLGYRPLRHVAIGVAYTGGGVRPDYTHPLRSYSKYGAVHSVHAIARPIVGVGPIDLGFEFGIGWSYLAYGLTAPVGFSRLRSQGFSAKVAFALDGWITNHFFMGVKVDLVMNLHTQTCMLGKSVDAVCVKRSEISDEPIPTHQLVPGVHLGLVY